MTPSVKELQSLDDIFNSIRFGWFHVKLILVCGVLQSFDAMELLVLAFLGPILSCYWKISAIEESFLTTSVFIGALVGGIVFGSLCDTYGRKSILIISSLSLIYSGMLSVFCPNVQWLIALRCLIGLFLGGIMVSLSTIVSELLPIKYRGVAVMIILGFWPLGSFLVTTLSMLVVPIYGWRTFLLISALPLLCTIPLFLWIPESPKFLMLKHRQPEVIAIINTIQRTNNSINETRIEDIQPPIVVNYSFKDLFKPDFIMTTIFTNVLWTISGISYYSIILMVTMVNEVPHNCLQNLLSQINSTNTTGDNSCCVRLVWKHYLDNYVSIVGEIVFLLLIAAIISSLSRKTIMALLSVLIAMCFILLNLCLSPSLLRVLLLVLRGGIFSLFNINYLYTSEVFPTSSRGLAIGLCNSSARVGSMLAPFIVNILVFRWSFVTGTIGLGCLNLLGFCIAILLPFETQNRKIFQTTSEMIKETTKKQMD